MTPRTARTVAIAAVVTAVLLLAGCSSQPDPPGARPKDPGQETPGTPARHRLDFDPERYVDEYESGSESGGTKFSGGGGVVAQSSSRTSADAYGGEMPPYVPTIDQDNTFVDPGRSGFVDTADDAKSTFGLDVDTGSFSVGRTFLTEGQRPPTASVRPEEWVNALGSNQAAPDDGTIGLSVDGAVAPFVDDGTRLVRVGVAARDLDHAERPPAHLTFVVDTSGSMDIRERLGLVKSSLALLVDGLRDGDTIGIVTYSDEAGTLLEPTKVEDSDRIVAAIEKLVATNSTNLDAGLRAGYKLADASFVEGDLNAVVLASDGVANVGLTDPDGLAGVIQDRGKEGIHLVTVGYGMGNYNDDLMEQIADRGDGFYSYLDTYAQAERFFRDRIASLLSVVARDAKAQITFDPEIVDSYRLVGYENRALDDEDFDDETVDAGEIGAGHRVTVLYEVRFPKDRRSNDRSPDTPLGTVSVRYEPVDGGPAVTVEEPITIADASLPFEDAPADLRLQASAAAFADWLAESPTAKDRKLTVAQIRELAAPAAAELPKAGLRGSVLTPEEFLDLLDLAGKATPPVTPEPGPGE